MQGETQPPADAPPGAATPGAPPAAKPGKYVPPSMRDGGNRRGESMTSNRRGMFHFSVQLPVIVCM